jgi:DNA-binding winged helix-turn-helix (wHTH) protein/TolB-like protein
MNKKTYAFGDFLLDLEQKRLLRNNQSIALQPKVFNMLVFFVERRGELVSRDELMQAVWADTFVEETNLRFCIHALRKALGDGYVETVPKRGYRFIAEVTENQPEIFPAQISADKISAEGAPPEIVRKNQFGKRYWLVGASGFSIVCLLILAFVWQKNSVSFPRNSSGVDNLAVLPFTQIGERDVNLQAGLADAMITNLSKIKQLKILPNSSVQKFVGRDFDALEVGRELKADSVLEGSYRHEGENVRVTARLLRVSNGETLWTETFTAQKLSNLELENLISLRTARLLWLKFAETEDEKSLAGIKINAEAVQNYLAGRRIWQSRELKRREEMIRLFERAIELAPDWSLAYSGLAEAALNEDTFSTDWKTAEQSARKALELDGANAQAHTALAQVYHRKYWDWENAEKSFQKAFEANPNYAHAHHEYGIFLTIRRRFSEAEAEMKKAVEAEPFSPFYFASLCELYSFDRRFDEALKQCDYAQNIEPDFWRTRKQLFWIYAQKQMYAEMSEMILGKASEAEKANHALTRALAASDLRSFWQSLIDERLNNSKNGASNSLAISTFYLQIDEKEKALNYLEKALDERDMFLPTANADSVFDSIRNEKRFADVMRKIGLQK